MRSDGPLGCLSDLFDSFVLEHFDEVLLDATFDDRGVVLGRAVDDRDLVGDLRRVCLIEFLPCLGVGEVKVHQEWIVRVLEVDPDVILANDRMNLPEWADRVRQAHI